MAYRYSMRSKGRLIHLPVESQTLSLVLTTPQTQTSSRLDL